MWFLDFWHFQSSSTPTINALNAVETDCESTSAGEDSSVVDISDLSDRELQNIDELENVMEIEFEEMEVPKWVQRSAEKFVNEKLKEQITDNIFQQYVQSGSHPSYVLCYYLMTGLVGW